ncbi:MAG: hypothetical protein WBB73_04135 [Candidatus Aminicenantaceae bacterium]
MKIRALSHLLFVFLFLILLVSNTSPSQEDKPLTRAESSEYNATSLHKDVLGFIQSLQGLSLRLRVETLSISAEGRKIPLLVWNFFDRQLASQWGRGQQVYPVYKLYTPVSLVKNALR